MKLIQKVSMIAAVLAFALSPFTASAEGTRPLKGRELTDLRQALISLVYVKTYHCPMGTHRRPRTIYGGYGLVDHRFELSNDHLTALIHLGERTYVVNGKESEQSDSDMVDLNIALSDGTVLASYSSILSYDVDVVSALAIVTGIQIAEVTDLSLKDQCEE